MAQQHHTPMGQGGQYGGQHGGQQMGGHGQQSRTGGQQYSGQQGGQQFGGQQGGMRSQTGGQQTGGQQMGGQQGGETFDDYLTGHERLVLHDVVKAAHTAAWCADLCIDEGPQMAACIRLCEDVEELGSVAQEFIARDSIFAPHVIETLIEAAEECAMECEQHQHPHCQENASVLHKLVQSGTEYLQQYGGQQSGTGQQSGMGQQSRTGGQQMGDQSRMGQQSGMGGQQMGGQSRMGQQSQTGGTNVPIGGSRY